MIARHYQHSAVPCARYAASTPPHGIFAPSQPHNVCRICNDPLRRALCMDRLSLESFVCHWVPRGDPRKAGSVLLLVLPELPARAILSHSVLR
jgi:hypothetical protein